MTFPILYFIPIYIVKLVDSNVAVVCIKGEHFNFIIPPTYFETTGGKGMIMSNGL